jgi:hypothetical protein
VPFYHWSPRHLAVGTVLTGPFFRGEVSRWAGVEPSYSDRFVYVLEGDRDPLTLLEGSAFTSGEAKYIYLVEPEGERIRDYSGQWHSWGYPSAVIVRRIYP